MEFYKGESMNEFMGFCLKPGTVLDGRYRITRVTGIGGFGITYEAANERIDLRVAVKEFYCRDIVYRDGAKSDAVILTAENAREDFQKAKKGFLKEARVISDFENEPGIVRILDYFEENNTAYIVMEYLDGITLRQYLQEHGPFHDRELVNLLIPLMETLRKIHACGIIHRDISPDNIMILNDGSAKLLDFGAAGDYLLEQNSTRFVVFRDGYTPCEQYDPQGKQGPWTDIYALCATMYECVTGRKPVSSPTRAANDEMRPISDTEIRISPQFRKILKKGLEINRKERYRDVSELTADLREWQKKYSRLQKKNPVLIACMLLFTCLAVCIGVGFGYYHQKNIEKLLFQGIETETVILVPDENMTAREYSESIDTIKKRTSAFAGNEKYLAEEENGQIRIVMPLSAYGEEKTAEEIEELVQTFIGNPMNLALAAVAFEESELEYEYCLMDREDIISIEAVEGTLPVGNSKEFEDYSYFIKFTVSESKAEEFREKLHNSQNNEKFSLRLFTDPATRYAENYLIAGNEELNTFYLPAGKNNNLWKSILEYPSVSEPFDVYAEIPVKWEKKMISEGESQCLEDEISMPAVCMEYGALGRDEEIEEGDWIENICNLTDILETLEIPYAMGNSAKERYSVIIKTAQKDMNPFLAEILDADRFSFCVTDGEKKLDMSMDQLSVAENDDGIYALQVRYLEPEEGDLQKAASESLKNGRREWMLMLKEYCIAKTAINPSGEDGTIIFEKSCIGRSEVFQKDTLPFLKAVEVISGINTVGMNAFYKKSSCYLSEENKIQTESRMENSLWKPVNFRFENIRGRITELYPQAEVKELRVGSSVDLLISFHLDAEKDSVETMLSMIKNVMENSGLNEAAYSEIYYYMEDEEEFPYVYCYRSMDEDNWRIYVHTSGENHAKICRESMESDPFYSEQEFYCYYHDLYSTVYSEYNGKKES